MLGAGAKAGRDKVTILASPALAPVGAWLEQLIAESTGKIGKGMIPVAGEAVGKPGVYGKDRLFAYLALKGDADADQEKAGCRAGGRGSAGGAHHPGQPRANWARSSSAGRSPPPSPAR